VPAVVVTGAEVVEGEVELGVVAVVPAVVVTGAEVVEGEVELGDVTVVPAVVVTGAEVVEGEVVVPKVYQKFKLNALQNNAFEN
jgi:hypothetical protein